MFLVPINCLSDRGVTERDDGGMSEGIRYYFISLK
jgi:hypothetical protein